MTELDKAYLAGIFDGEGCVGYYNATPTSSKRPAYHHAAVIITMTDPRIIQWVKEITGLGKVSSSIKTKPRRTAYSWCIGKKTDVIAFLSIIRPYLKLKGDQVDVLLAHFALEADYVQRHGSVTPEIVESRQQITDTLKRMKRDIVVEGVETRRAGSSIH